MYVEFAGQWAHRPAGAATLTLRGDPKTGGATLMAEGAMVRQWPQPLAALQWMSGHFPDGGYWAGYLSYDLGRRFESIGISAADDLGLPEIAFGYFPRDGSAAVVEPAASANQNNLIQSTFTAAAYRDAVRRCLAYIEAGDVFQINLSQRLTTPQTAPARSVYRRLEVAAPAAYGALLEWDDFALVCNSPELFLRVSRDPGSGLRRVVTRPIKGTRPRLEGMADALRDSAKDQAELNMIVDLERNDLGRVCRVGSVAVSQQRTIELHPTIVHGVATVEGILREEVSFVDLLAATFPGGSITGAPKVRAMQIIEQIEPVRRGPYCGAIGYLAADGSMEFNVAIRTMIFRSGLAHVPVGGGIVADSDPAQEYAETLVKAQAMLAALGVREGALEAD